MTKREGGGNDANDGPVEATQDEGRGFVGNFLRRCEGACASATTCLIPGAHCGDIEQGEFDLGRIDDLAARLYTKAAGDEETILSDNQTFADYATILSDTQTHADTKAAGDEETILSDNQTFADYATILSDTQTHADHATVDTGYYTDCCTDMNTIDEEGGAVMPRSSTYQSALTMNTFSTFEIAVRLQQANRRANANTTSTVNTMSAIGAPATAGSSVPIRCRTRSTHQSDATEPTRLARNASNATRFSRVSVSSNRRANFCVGASVEVELGKEPNTAQLPSTAVDIDECSVVDDEHEIDGEKEEYNILFVQDHGDHQEGPFAKERSLHDHPSLSTDPSTSEERTADSTDFGEEGEEIDYAVFKAGLEDTTCRPRSLKRRKAPRRSSTRRVPPPAFFAVPRAAGMKKPSPPPFFASDRAGKKSGKTGNKNKMGSSTTTRKKKTQKKKSADDPIADITAETLPLY